MDGWPRAMAMNETDAENMLAQLQHGHSKHPEARSELDDLDLRLVEAVSWCTRHSILKRTRRCLRPARIAPPPLPADRWEAVDWVIRARRSEFERTRDVTLDDVAGQLLIYFPDMNLFDGAAEVTSDEFFDVHNAPPWGTWVGYFEDRAADRDHAGYLLAWVPRVFLELARAGIDVNPEQCVVWLSDTHLALRHILQHTRFGKGLT